MYFPDTNFFFECRGASDLPWHELAPDADGEVTLLIPPTVINEIQSKKGRGNGRLARRARDASAMMRRALVSQHGKITLRGSNSSITLQLPPVVRVDWNQFSNLDRGRLDNWIAAEYATLVERGYAGLQVLTDDTLLVLAVRSLGYEPILIPENWRLPPEADERDDELLNLRREIKSLKETQPSLDIQIANEAGEQAAVCEITGTVYAPTEPECRSLVDQVQRSYPLVLRFGGELGPAHRHGFDAGRMEVWKEVTQGEIESYRLKHSKWLAEIEESLPKIASVLTEYAFEAAMAVQIKNDGFVNAEDVTLTITAFDGVQLLGRITEEEQESHRKRTVIPPAPVAPEGRYVSMRDLALAGFRPGLTEGIRPMRVQQRSRNEFHYVDRRPLFPVEELRLCCEAVPHQVEAATIGFRIRALPHDLGKAPRIRVRLEAANLRVPIERCLRVSVTSDMGSLRERLGL